MWNLGCSGVQLRVNSTRSISQCECKKLKIFQDLTPKLFGEVSYKIHVINSPLSKWLNLTVCKNFPCKLCFDNFHNENIENCWHRIETFCRNFHFYHLFKSSMNQLDQHKLQEKVLKIALKRVETSRCLVKKLKFIESFWLRQVPI